MFDLNTINLNLLYTFHVFSKQKTVQATASKLGRSQPAISARLHAIEEELHATLMERCGRGLELTPLGRVLSARLDDLFVNVQGILDEARASSRDMAGIIRIGALPTVGVHILAPKISEFQKRYSRVQIELLYGVIEPQLAGLRRGDLDLVFGVGTLPSDGVDAVQVGTTRPVVVRKKKTGSCAYQAP